VTLSLRVAATASSIQYPSATGLRKPERSKSAQVDGALGKSGMVTIRRDDKRWMELVFVDDAELARRRSEFLKAKRK
jgi:hypothetical protein